MSDIVPGQKVLYVPEDCHFADKDSQGEHLFHFHHQQDAPGRHRKGDLVDMKKVGAVARDDTGKLTTAQGHVIAPGAPVRPWPATVVRVNADGTVDLDVDHPCGWVTLHYPSRDRHPDAPGVPLDPTGKRPRSFHLPLA